ncbi:hypothetical protein GQX74_001063 [Glossina fuscipes]|nr:hypothetical protein GQX74_001063 [Glossina fuscipes]
MFTRVHKTNPICCFKKITIEFEGVDLNLSKISKSYLKTKNHKELKKMPRRNKKGGKGRLGDSNSEDESYNDNVSVYSYASDNAPSSVNDCDELSSNERYEERFIQALENATEKSAQTRTLALQSICEILMHRYMPDFVDDRKVTLIDCIEKSIRRGKGAEQAWGARLAPLLVLQLGGDETISKTLNQFLLTTVQDKSVTFDARAKCCTALGLLNFFGGEDIGDLLTLMQCFESIFSGSYLKADDKVPISVSTEASTLHAEALSAWGLLLTLIPPGDFVAWMTSGQPVLPSFKKIMGLLQSPHLDVRMAAGETLALILECGRSHDEEFLEDYLIDLIDMVKQLATDSHKYRAKRDRKAQRATFRDVLRYLEDDILPEITIRFGSESLVLDSWAIHHQYSALCVVMGPGMTNQLQENDFIRDIFGLGSKVNTMNGSAKAKASKLERHLLNAAAFKARTISRGKNRDKRSAVLT